jgi:hypothetical protein
MDSGTTYDVRFHKTHVYKGSRVTTYYVRWTVAGQPRKQSFRTRALADSFRAELLSAARRGEAFCTDTGLPVSRNRDGLGMTWYELACSYSTMKWPYASPNHRRGIAEALTDATEVLIRPDGIPLARSELRAALREWTFSSRITAGGQPPADLSPAIGWLERNTIPLASLTGDDGPALARRVLDRISRRQDGTMAAANTANRKRMVLSNVMEYACEIKALTANPLRQLKWARPRTLRAVDPLVVLSSDQARSFLAEVGRHGPRGERLVTFFGCMYYAALRPEDRHRQIARATRTQAPRSRRNPPRPRAPGTRHPAARPHQAIQRPSRPAGVRRTTRRHSRGMGLPRGLPRRPQADPQHCRDPDTPAEQALRPAARRRIDVAQRRRPGRPGRRMGGPQRRRPPARLRQMHRRAAVSSDAANRERHAAADRRHARSQRRNSPGPAG